MESNRGPTATTGKWVSRRALASQAHARDSNTTQHGRVPAARGAFDHPERQKFGHFNFTSNNTSGGNGGGSSRYGATHNGSAVHPAAGYRGSAVGNNSGNGGNGAAAARRNFGYNDGEPTLLPPPRSARINNSSSGAIAATNPSRDFIPQPRHAMLNNSEAVNHNSHSSSSNHNHEAAGRRWPSTSHGAVNTPNIPSQRSAMHYDAAPSSKGMLQSQQQRPPPSSSVAAAPPQSSPLQAALTNGRGADGQGMATPTTAVATTNTGNCTMLAAAPPPSSLTGDALLKQFSVFGDESVHFCPVDDVVVQQSSTASPEPALDLSWVLRGLTGGSAAPRSAAPYSSAKQTSATARGLEEVIRQVLPGMDEEDDNVDDVLHRNTTAMTAGTTATAATTAATNAGGWHCTSELDALTGLPRGDFAQFHTSFAASLSEPTSCLPASPQTAEPSSTQTMNSLSRVFSTAARLETSPFASMPLATTATAAPAQRLPTSPSLFSQLTGSEEPTAMPLAPGPASTTSASIHDIFGINSPPNNQLKNLFTELAQPTSGGDVADKGSATNDCFPFFSKSAITSQWLPTTTNDSTASLFTTDVTSYTADLPRKAMGTDSLTSHPHPTPLSNRLAEALAKEGVTLAAANSTASHHHLHPHHTSNHHSSGGSSNGPALTTAAAAGAMGLKRSSGSSHDSAPNTPSLRRDLGSPTLSGSRSQPHTPGSCRPQRPSLCAPTVTRRTIAQIFRETPQSLQRKERMADAHRHSPEALCRCAGWPPQSEEEVEQMLREVDALKLLRHLTIISFSRQHIEGVQDLFSTWARNGIPAPDMGFGAYYYYVKEKSEKLLCMKHNGRGATPGHGYGKCDFESRRPYSTCRYEHVCLFCRSKEHGWFEEGKCQVYQQLLTEMERLGIDEGDVAVLLDAMERPSRPPAWGGHK